MVLRSHKKLLFIFIATLNALFLNKNSSRASDVVRPLSVDERLKVITRYYADNIDNPDPSIFDHYKQWHDHDVRLLRSRLQDPNLVKRLDDYSALMTQSFNEEDPKVIFAKLGATYYLYSVLVSKSNNPKKQETEKVTAEAVKFLTTGQQTPQEECSKDVLLCDAYKRKGLSLINFCKDGFRILPFVSLSGYSSFRTLNHTFGLRTPSIGLPLKNQGYDGITSEDADEEEFFDHDTRHAIFSEVYEDPERHTSVLHIYSLYNQLDRLVQSLQDSQEQLLCDMSLFEVGHEGGFGYYSYAAFLNRNSTRTEDFEPVPPKFLSPACFSEICDKNLAEDIEELTTLPEKGWRGGPSLGERILESNLPHDRPINRSELKDDFSEHVNTRMVYNTLFSMKHLLPKYFKTAYEIWVGDRINVEGIIQFYTNMNHTFKRVIGPKFKESKEGFYTNSQGITTSSQTTTPSQEG